eukprot:7660863-Prorocentrum_lima.AAC.1
MSRRSTLNSDSRVDAICGVGNDCTRASVSPLKTISSILCGYFSLLAHHVTTMADLVLPEWISSKSPRQPIVQGFF